MPPQQHLYNGLARPSGESMLVQEWIRPHDSVLAYTHAAGALRASRCCHGTDNQTNRRREGQGENKMPWALKSY